MATPKTITDNSTALNEAALNLFLRSGKLQAKLNYVGILFTAATNTPTVTGADSDGEIVNGDLSWDAVDNEIDIVLSGFVSAPVMLVSMVRAANLSTNIEDVYVNSISSALAHIRFVGSGAGGAAVDPDGNVTINLLVVGA